MIIKKISNILNFSSKLIICTYLTCPHLFASDYILATRPTFPEKLDNSTFVEYRHGAGGGVSIIEQDGVKYALKSAENPEYLKQEALANYLYMEFGVKVPHFALYKSLGNLAGNTDIQSHIPTNTSLFMLSEFIEGEALKNLQDDNLKQQINLDLSHDFLVDAFLSNWDLHGDNIRIGQNQQPVRVDNGGSLDAHAAGNWKAPRDNWDPSTVSELRTMRLSEKQWDYLKDLSKENIISAISPLLGKQTAILTKILSFSNLVDLENRDILLNRIIKRFEYLQLLQSRSSISIADKDELAGLSAAGVFLTTIINDIPHTLIAKRAGSGLWCNPGGKSDQEDQFLYDSAARETREETHGKILITADELRDKPSHDLLPDYLNNPDSKDIRYRMYFAEHQYIAPEELITSSADNPDMELTEFMWIPTDCLVNPSSSITLDDGRILDLYPPFHKMLTQSPVIEMVKKITLNKRLKTRHTQGIEDPSETLNKCVLPQLKTQWSDPFAPDTEVYENLSESWGKLLSTKRLVDSNGKIILVEQKFGNPYADSWKLAWSVLTHSQAMMDLKNKFKQPKTSNAPLQLSASDHHLKRALGEKWVEVEPNSLDEQEKTKKNVEAFFQLDPSSFHQNPPTSFIDQYVQMLMAERRHPEYVASYHGTTPEIASAVSFFTYMRHLLAINQSDSIFMRGTDRAFIHPDVQSFISHFRDEGGHIDNYEDSDKGRYTEMGLSVVPFLFAGPTINFYEQGNSAKIFHGQSLINTLLSYLGLNLQDEQWRQVFESYLTQTDGKNNGALYQILTPIQTTEKTSYMAVAGGTEAMFEQADGTFSSSIAPLQLLKTTPERFWDKFNAAYANHTYDSLDKSDLQLRHYMHPEYWQLNIIHEYRHFPVNINALKSLTSRFTAQFLYNNRELPERTVYSPSIEGSTDPLALRQLYRLVYQVSTGIALVEKPISVNMLSEFLDQGNVLGFNLIMAKYPDLDLTQPIQQVGGKGKSGQSEKQTPLTMIYELDTDTECRKAATGSELGIVILDRILGKQTIEQFLESDENAKYHAVYFSMIKRQQSDLDKMSARGLQVSAQTVLRTISMIQDSKATSQEQDFAFFKEGLAKLSRNGHNPKYMRKGLTTDIPVAWYGNEHESLNLPPLFQALQSGSINAFLFLANLGKDHKYAGYESTTLQGLNILHFLNCFDDEHDDTLFSWIQTLDPKLITKLLGSYHTQSENSPGIYYNFYNNTPLMRNFVPDSKISDFLWEFSKNNNWIGLETDFSSLLYNLARIIPAGETYLQRAKIELSNYQQIS